MGIDPTTPLKWSRKVILYYNSKQLRNNNYFVLYDLNDELICLFDNYNELSKHITQRLHDLAYEYKRHKSNVITIEIDRKKYKLATFC